MRCHVFSLFLRWFVLQAVLSLILPIQFSSVQFPLLVIASCTTKFVQGAPTAHLYTVGEK